MGACVFSKLIHLLLQEQYHALQSAIIPERGLGRPGLGLQKYLGTLVPAVIVQFGLRVALLQDSHGMRVVTFYHMAPTSRSHFY